MLLSPSFFPTQYGDSTGTCTGTCVESWYMIHRYIVVGYIVVQVTMVHRVQQYLYLVRCACRCARLHTMLRWEWFCTLSCARHYDSFTLVIVSVTAYKTQGTQLCTWCYGIDAHVSPCLVIVVTFTTNCCSRVRSWYITIKRSTSQCVFSYTWLQRLYRLVFSVNYSNSSHVRHCVICITR